LHPATRKAEELRLEPAPERARLLPPRARLVVVDAHGHAFRAFWGLEPMYAPDGLPTNALFGLAGLLRRIVFEEQPDYVAVVFDAPDEVRRTFRTSLYPAYKAHRPERPPELALQLPILREVAHACGLKTLMHPDFEADDIVATIVAQAEASNVHTTILSADKDLLQLVSDRTLVWDAMRGKRYTQAGVEEKLGVGPAMVADYLALCGDASDNVPGVPGIGPKSAATLLRVHGSLDGIYTVIDSGPVGAGEPVPTRDKRKLVEHRERAFLSRSLTRLRSDVPLDFELEDLALPREVTRDLGDALWRRLGFGSFLGRHAAPTPRPELRPTPVAGVVAAPPTLPAAMPLSLSLEVELTAAGPLEGAGVEALAAVIGEQRAPIEVTDLAGLLLAVREARAALAFGLAFAGGTPEVVAAGRVAVKSERMARRAEHAYVAPVLGLAVPSGASWRLNLQGGTRGLPGRAIQGFLFGSAEAEAGLTLTDAAAAIASLLADSRRVLCAHDAQRLVILGIAPSRAAFREAAEVAPDSATAAEGGTAVSALDPALAALEALSGWLARGAA